MPSRSAKSPPRKPGAKPATGKSAGKTRGLKCPICRRPAAADYRPFCGLRCQETDLSRWLTGSYAIPGDPSPDGYE